MKKKHHIHVAMIIKKKGENKLAKSCFGFICCCDDAVLSLLGVLGREGRKQRGRDGQREIKG